MALEIDWPYWLELELWGLDDAICLVFRLHPADFRDAPNAYADGVYPRQIEGRDSSLSDEITMQHSIALSAIEAGTLRNRSQSGNQKVNPTEFAKWASTKGWNLPEQFGSLVTATETGMASLKNPKHRNSWRNLLGALCMKADIDYRKRGADAKLVKLTERCGVPVSRNTIKAIIDELSNHVEWQDAPRN